MANMAASQASSIRTLPVIRAVPFLLLQSRATSCLTRGGEWILLSVLGLLGISILGDYLLLEPAREFSPWGFSSFAFQLCLLLLFAYLVTKSRDCQLNPLLFTSLVLEIWLVLSVIRYAAYLLATSTAEFDQWVLLSAFFVGWEVAAVATLLLLTFAPNVFAAKGYLFCYAVLTLLPVVVFDHFRSDFWYTDYSQEEDYSYLQTYMHDEVLYSQDALIDTALDTVAEGQPDDIELFYLGFASYASQSVFQSEVEFIDQLFRENFYDDNRGLILNNRPETIDTTPLAIKRNIQLALNGLATKMNPEDILFMYLTTHGSKNHELAIEFYPFELSDLTPPELRTYLDNSGIKWRILVVSACYSGGFIEDLADDYTLVATAASATDTSFGCSDAREFTYYGEALFKDNLSRNKPLLSAFRDAIESIQAREEDEGKKPSHPQLIIGSEIEQHIARFESRMAAGD